MDLSFHLPFTSSLASHALATLRSRVVSSRAGILLRPPGSSLEHFLQGVRSAAYLVNHQAEINCPLKKQRRITRTHRKSQTYQVWELGPFIHFLSTCPQRLFTSPQLSEGFHFHCYSLLMMPTLTSEDKRETLKWNLL